MNVTPREIPGLIWAFRLAAGEGPPVPLGPLDRERVLSESDGFVWLHFALSDARVPGFLGEVPGLPEQALQTLTGRESHPTLDVDEGVLHGVVLDFQRTFDEETRDFGWMRFALNDRMILTTRLHPLRSVDRAKSIVEQSLRIQHPTQVLEAIMMEFHRALHGIIGELNDELNRIEDYVVDDAPRDERRRLGPARRVIVRLHRQLRAAYAMVRRVETFEEEDASEVVRAWAERTADRLERADRDIASLHERARLLHEEIDSKISSETNRHLYILSVMTAFLLPPTLVAGIFGMNTGGLPWQHAAGGTWYAVGLCALSIAAAWGLLRRSGIL